MMSEILIALFIFLGLGLLIFELLVIPGTTVVGIVGFILMVVGIWQSFAHYGTSVGFAVLSGSVILSILGVYLSLRSNTWKQAMLHSSISSKVNLQSNQVSVGDVGKSLSRINPMGKALFNNEFYEVASRGEMIDENKEIRIIDIQANKIIVEVVNAINTK